MTWQAALIYLDGPNSSISRFHTFTKSIGFFSHDQAYSTYMYEPSARYGFFGSYAMVSLKHFISIYLEKCVCLSLHIENNPSYCLLLTVFSNYLNINVRDERSLSVSHASSSKTYMCSWCEQCPLLWPNTYIITIYKYFLLLYVHTIVASTIMANRIGKLGVWVDMMWFVWCNFSPYLYIFSM